MVPYVQLYYSCVPLNTYIRFPFPDFWVFFWPYLTFCFVPIFFFPHSDSQACPPCSRQFYQCRFPRENSDMASFLKSFSFFPAVSFLSRSRLWVFFFCLLISSLNTCVCLSSCSRKKSFFHWILDVVEKCLFIPFITFLLSLRSFFP